MQILLSFKSSLFTHFHLFFVAFFFVYFADAVMSYFFPVAAELTLGSNTILGIVMALSSVVSIICDLTFPELLHGKTWKSLFIAGVVVAFSFPVLITLGYTQNSVVYFILGAIAWGLYYELLSFAMQNYIVLSGNNKTYSSLWGIASIIMSICFIVGPIVGSSLFDKRIEIFLGLMIFLQTIAFIFAVFFFRKHPIFKQRVRKLSKSGLEKLENQQDKIHGIKPFLIILKSIYPLVTLDMALSMITSSFWTLGGLFGLQLFNDSGADWLVIVVFSAPMLIGSAIVYKLRINKGKKRLSTLFLMLAGFFLLGVKLFESQNVLILVSVALCSFSLSFSFPLDQAVFSDLQRRAMRFKFYIASMDNLGNSIAYVLGPLITGFLADRIGYFNTFGAIGIFSISIGVILLIITPRKLKIPQKELKL